MHSQPVQAAQSHALRNPAFTPLKGRGKALGLVVGSYDLQWMINILEHAVIVDRAKDQRRRIGLENGFAALVAGQRQ